MHQISSFSEVESDFFSVYAMVQSLSSALNELECEVLGTQIESECTQYERSVPTVRQVFESPC
jgi:hypothetical protein